MGTPQEPVVSAEQWRERLKWATRRAARATSVAEKERFERLAQKYQRNLDESAKKT
jgi:hypothetical protein